MERTRHLKWSLVIATLLMLDLLLAVLLILPAFPPSAVDTHLSFAWPSALLGGLAILYLVVLSVLLLRAPALTVTLGSDWIRGPSRASFERQRARLQEVRSVRRRWGKVSLLLESGKSIDVRPSLYGAEGREALERLFDRLDHRGPARGSSHEAVTTS